MKVYSNEKFSVSTSCEETYRGIIYVTNKETNWQYQLKIHQDWVSGLELIDYGLITCSIDGTVAVSDLNEAKVLATEDINHPITCMEVLDVATILLGSNDGFITVLNMLKFLIEEDEYEVELPSIVHQIDTGKGPIQEIREVGEEGYVVLTVHFNTIATWDITEAIHDYIAKIETDESEEDY
jgi:WD40 repeat protein